MSSVQDLVGLGGRNKDIIIRIMFIIVYYHLKLRMSLLYLQTTESAMLHLHVCTIAQNRHFSFLTVIIGEGEISAIQQVAICNYTARCH